MTISSVTCIIVKLNIPTMEIQTMHHVYTDWYSPGCFTKNYCKRSLVLRSVDRMTFGCIYQCVQRFDRISFFKMIPKIMAFSSSIDMQEHEKICPDLFRCFQWMNKSLQNWFPVVYSNVMSGFVRKNARNRKLNENYDVSSVVLKKLFVVLWIAFVVAFDFRFNNVAQK